MKQQVELHSTLSRSHLGNSSLATQRLLTMHKGYRAQRVMSICWTIPTPETAEVHHHTLRMGHHLRRTSSSSTRQALQISNDLYACVGPCCTLNSLVPWTSKSTSATDTFVSWDGFCSDCDSLGEYTPLKNLY